MISATNKITGEVIELPTENLAQIVEAWRIAKEYGDTADRLKDQLKAIVPDVIDDNGRSEAVGSFMFRVSNVQRMNYDKTTLRQFLDPDVYDVLLKPDKPAVDTYIKENLDMLGEASTLLRKSMVPEGKAYQVIRLEKLDREV